MIFQYKCALGKYLNENMYNVCFISSYLASNRYLKVISEDSCVLRSDKQCSKLQEI